MLPRSSRLSSKEVERLMKEGRSLAAGSLRAKYLKSSTPTSRFAFVVSKKIARDAVTRNRLRRWGAVAARGISQTAPIDAAVTVLIRYENLTRLREDLTALLARATR